MCRPFPAGRFTLSRGSTRFGCGLYNDRRGHESGALADAAIAYRFVGLQTGGQDSAFVFGEPEAILRAAERGLLLFSESDAAGLDRGKAFEEAVIQRLTRLTEADGPRRPTYVTSRHAGFRSRPRARRAPGA
jgi:hypothetical protein